MRFFQIGIRGVVLLLLLMRTTEGGAQVVQIDVSFDSAGYVKVTPERTPPTGAHSANVHLRWVSTVAGCHPIIHIDDDGQGDAWKQPNCPGNDRCETNTPHKKKFAGVKKYKYFVRLACENGHWAWVDPEIAIAGEGVDVHGHPKNRPGGSARGDAQHQYFRDAEGKEHSESQSRARKPSKH